jgi:hypothetical protein
LKVPKKHSGPQGPAWEPGDEIMLIRSASEVKKLFPRLRFGLVRDAPNLTESGLYGK